MPSQPQRARLVRRAPAPTSPLRPQGSQPQRPNPNLIRRVQVPISPPRTSPQPEQLNADNNEPEDDEESGEYDQEEDLGQKRKQPCNSLRDALEEEAGRKKRKRGIIK